MKLKEIRIDGFRSIENTNIKLEELSAIISSSSVVKNDLIKAIKFGFSLITETDNRNFLYLSKREKYSSSSNKNFHFEIIYDSTFEGENIEVDYFYDLDWKENNNLGIINEFIKYKPVSSQRQTTLYERHYTWSKYKPSRQRPCEYEVVLSDCSLMANNILLYKDLYYDAIIKELFNVDFLYAGPDGYSFTNTKNKYLDNGTTFDCSMNDFTKNIYVISKNYPEHFDYIYYYTSKIFNEIADLNVAKQEKALRNSDPTYTLYLKFKGVNELVGIEDTPVEVKKIVDLYVLSTIAKIKNTSLVIFDEIENSINPMILTECIQSIKKILSNSSVIISTYSPVIIDNIDINNIYIGVRTSNPAVKFKTIKPTYFKRIFERCDKYEMPLGYYIFNSIANKDTFENEILKEALI